MTSIPLIRAVAEQFDFEIQVEVERLIAGGGEESSETFSGTSATNVAVAALIVATVSMTCNIVNLVRQTGALPVPAQVERQVTLEIVSPQGISQVTLKKIVHAAVVEAMKSQK
jgi:transcription initiation factor TFIIIB Brf1 subunit/transcription initiation factor TFIIB